MLYLIFIFLHYCTLRYGRDAICTFGIYVLKLLTIRYLVAILTCLSKGENRSDEP